MFTGLVSDVGRVAAVSGDSKLKRIAIDCAYDPAGILIGASIACSGPCLTAVTVTPREGGCTFEVDAAAETLARTTVGMWVPGMRVNLERSLKIGDELGGHLVTGHVDGPRRDRRPRAGDGAGRRRRPGEGELGPERALRAPAPPGPSRFIAEKGSVCLDGTSRSPSTASRATPSRCC